MCDDTCVCLRRLAFDFPSLSRDIKHQTRIDNQRKPLHKMKIHGSQKISSSLFSSQIGFFLLFGVIFLFTI